MEIMLRAVVVVAQGKKQGGTFLQAQGLGAGGRFHTSLRQSGAQMTLRIRSLEVIPQGFALLAEGEFEEVDEAVVHLSIGDESIAVESQLLLSRRDGQAKCGGMDFRRRGKSARRKRKQLVPARIELRGGREQTVIAAAGFGGNAVRHFTLHQDNDGLKIPG